MSSSRSSGVRINLGSSKTVNGTEAVSSENRIALSGAPAETRYHVRALDPQSGRWSDYSPVAADFRGHLRVAVPAFREDLLIELTRTDGGAAHASA